MRPEAINACVKIAACICGKDGILSEREVDEIYSLITSEHLDYKRDLFEVALDEFFDSTLQIEDYLALVSNPSDQKAILKIAAISAAVDGLAPLENIALQKAELIWAEGFGE